MKKLSIAGTLAVFLLASAPGARAGVTVTVANPQNFADLPYAGYDRDRTLSEIQAHFARKAAALPAGQDLKIEILDIDLAGRIKPSRRASYDIRILNGGADWPHMHLRYTLESNGKVIGSGDEHLSNMAYLNRLNKYSSGDNLRYEKQMIDDWFAEKFRAKPG
jgi:hypothetical protein